MRIRKETGLTLREEVALVYAAAFYVPIDGEYGPALRKLAAEGLVEVAEHLVRYPWGESRGFVATATASGRERARELEERDRE